MLRVMLIEAINYSDPKETLFPSLGLGYLASSLRQEFGFNDIDIKIVRTDIEQQIKGFKPDIVGITSTSRNYNRAVEYARTAKRYGLPVIIGGVHISVLPSSLTSDVDAAVIGEGERTVVDLVRLFQDTGSLGKDELLKIDGIAFRENGELILTNKRQLIEPLDSIPMPARDLLPVNDGVGTMLTSRGCPYRCVYCASRLWPNVRSFSPEYVVDEIEYLVREYRVKRIFLYDDLFIVNKRRLERVADLLEERPIAHKVAFTAVGSSNLVDDEVAAILKRMNVTHFGIGFESGCPATLNYLKCGRVSIDNHSNAIRILRDHGIRVGGSFVIGSPKETREDFLQTLRFVKSNRLTTVVDFLLLTPLPGTPLWDYAKARGLVSDDMDWEVLDTYLVGERDKAVILSETMTRDEVYELFSMVNTEWRKAVLWKHRWELLTRTPWRIPQALVAKFNGLTTGKLTRGRDSAQVGSEDHLS